MGTSAAASLRNMFRRLVLLTVPVARIRYAASNRKAKLHNDCSNGPNYCNLTGDTSAAVLAKTSTWFLPAEVTTSKTLRVRKDDTKN